MYLRLFAHVLVGFLIGALYYDIGNDGAKVLSNLGFLFFNMLFLMYTSMTITILSCEIPHSMLSNVSLQIVLFSPSGDAGFAERELQSMVLASQLLPGDNHFRYSIPSEYSQMSEKLSRQTNLCRRFSASSTCPSCTTSHPNRWSCSATECS